jgi:hypothetical protein
MRAPLTPEKVFRRKLEPDSRVFIIPAFAVPGSVENLKSTYFEVSDDIKLRAIYLT